MAQTATLALPADAPIDRRRFIAFFAMVFGMFMAILDIQIVSASLVEIQAGLGASAEEISWVQTAYLIAEVIMIPLSGFLSRVLSTRWIFTISAGGFTLTSFLCGISTSIDQMIVFRALQGFIGGGMIPTVFASAFTIFPRSKQPIISPLIGLVATLAPTIGPTVGGYLTQAVSWHWLFFINVVPGIVVTIMAATLIDFDKPNLPLFRKFDWWGMTFMAVFLGSLQYVLEEGPRNDWFHDRIIFIFALACAITAIGFFWRAFTASEPIVDLRAFGNRNFATGSVFSFVMGIGLYGLTYLYPIYLARIRGHSALMIGETMFVTGIFMFLTAPVAGALMRIMDPRVMLFMGFFGFGAGTYIMTDVTHDWDFWELFWPQVLRGSSLMICMVPINNVALGTLALDRLKNAAGLYNLTRNLGGAVGLAVINTMLTDRADLHYARLRDHANWANNAAIEMLNGLSRVYADFGDNAATIALRQMLNITRREALMMSFADIFYVLTVLFVALSLSIVLVKRPATQGAAGGGH